MAASQQAGTAAAAQAGQQPKAVLCFRKDGLLVRMSSECVTDFCCFHYDPAAMSPEEVDAVLAQRRASWKPKSPKYPSGVLKIFSQHAVSPMKGGYMD